MPARGALANSVIDTGEVFQDALSNIKQLIEEHLSFLSIEGKSLTADNIFTFDEFKIFHTPAISIVFNAARIVDTKIGNCLILGLDFSIYYYFQSLSFGNDTFTFLAPLYRLMEIFIIHQTIYNFVNGSGAAVEIPNTSLVGRRLDSNAFLTGLLNLTLNVRSCRDDHL